MLKLRPRYSVLKSHKLLFPSPSSDIACEGENINENLIRLSFALEIVGVKQLNECDMNIAIFLFSHQK